MISWSERSAYLSALTAVKCWSYVSGSTLGADPHHCGCSCGQGQWHWRFCSGATRSTYFGKNAIWEETLTWRFGCSSVVMHSIWHIHKSYLCKLFQQYCVSIYKYEEVSVSCFLPRTSLIGWVNSFSHAYQFNPWKALTEGQGAAGKRERRWTRIADLLLPPVKRDLDFERPEDNEHFQFLFTTSCWSPCFSKWPWLSFDSNRSCWQEQDLSPLRLPEQRCKEYYR